MTYDDDPPHIRGSDTSRAAADGIRDSVNVLQQRVLNMLSTGPMTDEEMQVTGDMFASTQRPRRIELWQRGLVCDSGQRRLTSRMKFAVVWQLHAGLGCPCGGRGARRGVSPNSCAGNEAPPDKDTIRAALASLNKLWLSKSVREDPKLFSPELINIRRWLIRLSEK